MPEIVKTDAPQAVGFQKLRKLLRHIVRLDEIANLVDEDIACILFVVRLPAEPSVVILLRFDSKQTFLDERHQREGSHTGLGFGGICRHENVLIIEVHRCSGVTDNDGVVLKINGIPFKADGFAAAKAVESTEQNRKLKLGSFGNLKELVHFVGTKEASDEMIFLGTLHFIRRIRRNQIQLDCVFQSLVNVRMVMDDGRSTHAFQLEQIEVLDVLCRQLLEGDSSLAEVRRDNTLHGCCVGSVCSDCDGAFHDIKPLLHVISEKYISLYQFFGLELLTFFHQKGFGLFLVVLHSETGGDPLGLFLSKGIVVIQDGIIIAVFSRRCPATIL